MIWGLAVKSLNCILYSPWNYLKSIFRFLKLIPHFQHAIIFVIFEDQTYFLCNEDMRLKKVFQRWHSEAFHLVCILKTGEMCLTLFNIFLSITDIEFLINKGKVMLKKNLISNIFSLITVYVFQIWLQDQCKKYMSLIRLLRKLNFKIFLKTIFERIPVIIFFFRKILYQYLEAFSFNSWNMIQWV